MHRDKVADWIRRDAPERPTRRIRPELSARMTPIFSSVESGLLRPVHPDFPECRFRMALGRYPGCRQFRSLEWTGKERSLGGGLALDLYI